MLRSGKATDIANKKKRLETKKKRDTILIFIKSNPDETVFSISESLVIPLSTVRNLVYQLVELKKVRIDEDTSTGRLKKLIRIAPNPIFEAEFDYFLFENFQNEKIGKRERYLAEKTLANGVTITVEMPNKEVVKIRSGESLDELLDSMNIAVH